MEKIYLEGEFEKFWQKLLNKENFTLLRYGDGERAIMMGEAIVAQEGWGAPNSLTKLGKDLLNSLNFDDKNVYYGISCPCCDLPAYYWYSTRINNKNCTFSNLWINKNYQKFIAEFANLKRDAVLIANYRARNKKIGNLNILKHYEIDDDCINFWENKAEQLINQIKQDFGTRDNLLYVISTGPMSNPLILELYKNNPNNCYIDFGSSIDEYLYQKNDRPYANAIKPYASRNCWMYNPKKVNFDVSVILNLYKRPQNLVLQLEALEKQTLQPKEILLYQDGTSDTIKIPNSLKEKFNLIEISPENRGVWARFDFAKRKANSKYICVFDDDTVCGSSWLENCHFSMLKQEGLYGTVGVVLTKPRKYPNKPEKNYFRIGWVSPNQNTMEVDFVGHSWFFQKEWLVDLFQAPEKIRKYKLVGEDMSFSYQLGKRGIKTFVPPHPIDNLSLFGSLPNMGNKLATQDVAISANSQSWKDMNQAINILMDNNWQILIKRRFIYHLYKPRVRKLISFLIKLIPIKKLRKKLYKKRKIKNIEGL